MTALTRIFKVGKEALYAQMVNPDYASKSCRPVIHRVRMMLHDLNESGGEELARAMLDYMAAGIDRHSVPNATAIPDKDSLLAECLDDHPEIVELHRLVQAQGTDVRAVEAQAEEVKREVDETVVAFRNSVEGV